MSALNRLVASICIAFAGSSAYAAPGYDAASQFDLTSNPAAVGGWSYGYSASLTGQFFLMSTPYAFQHLAGWTTSGPIAYPDILKNISGVDVSDPNGGYFPQGALTLAPGQGSTAGLLAIVRWTAPSSGEYYIQSTFTGIWNHADSAGDVHISLNGTALFDGAIDRQSSTNYSDSVLLTAGDHLDFAVGQTTPNTWTRSVLQATVTAVPETGTMLLLSMGLGALSLLSLRHRACSDLQS